MNKFLESLARRGAQVTGSAVPGDFVSGWACHPMVGRCAHHWTADRRFRLPDSGYGTVSACGLTTVATRRVPLLEPGTFDLCLRCERRLMRRIKVPKLPTL